MNSEKRYEEGRKFPIIFVQKKEKSVKFCTTKYKLKCFEEFVPHSPGLP